MSACMSPTRKAAKKPFMYSLHDSFPSHTMTSQLTKNTKDLLSVANCPAAYWPIRIASAFICSSPISISLTTSWHMQPTTTATEELSAPPERESKNPEVPLLLK
uniref:Uncharacterized protein n=1 Tax=Opuntia streptacantha TaxID=393608 RepID=A0A7C9E5S2_OPUST